MSLMMQIARMSCPPSPQVSTASTCRPVGRLVRDISKSFPFWTFLFQAMLCVAGVFGMATVPVGIE